MEQADSKSVQNSQSTLMTLLYEQKSHMDTVNKPRKLLLLLCFLVQVRLMRRRARGKTSVVTLCNRAGNALRPLLGWQSSDPGQASCPPSLQFQVIGILPGSSWRQSLASCIRDITLPVAASDGTWTAAFAISPVAGSSSTGFFLPVAQGAGPAVCRCAKAAQAPLYIERSHRTWDVPASPRERMGGAGLRAARPAPVLASMHPSAGVQPGPAAMFFGVASRSRVLQRRPWRPVRRRRCRPVGKTGPK